MVGKNQNSMAEPMRSANKTAAIPKLKTCETLGLALNLLCKLIDFSYDMPGLVKADKQEPK